MIDEMEATDEAAELIDRFLIRRSLVKENPLAKKKHSTALKIIVSVDDENCEVTMSAVITKSVQLPFEPVEGHQLGFDFQSGPITLGEAFYCMACNGWHATAHVAFDQDEDGENDFKDFLRDARAVGFRLVSIEHPSQEAKHPLEWAMEEDEDENPIWTAASNVNLDDDPAGGVFAKYRLVLLLKCGRPQWYCDHESELITDDNDGQRWHDDIEAAKRAVQAEHDARVDAERKARPAVQIVAESTGEAD